MQSTKVTGRQSLRDGGKNGNYIKFFPVNLFDHLILVLVFLAIKCPFIGKSNIVQSRACNRNLLIEELELPTGGGAKTG